MCVCVCGVVWCGVVWCVCVLCCVVCVCVCGLVREVEGDEVTVVIEHQPKLCVSVPYVPLCLSDPL